MNTLVYDIAASESGALSILEEFYQKFKIDKENQYFFVISTPELKETDNIHVIRYPWIKKSWGHRLWFDYFCVNKILKKYEIDKVFSLQNILVPKCNLKQILYLHQALPFVDYKFKFNEDKKIWIYQKIIGRIIKKSVIKADKVIVQSQWMKSTCIEQTKIKASKIEVQQPTIDMSQIKQYVDRKEHRKILFYPSAPIVYKNHMIVLKACKLLEDEGISDYKVIFTFKGNENMLARELYAYAKKNRLNIEFKGNIPRKEVFEMYAKAVLIFPSYIETFGLPLLEAKMSETYIIAAKEKFSNEILKNYNKVFFFEKNNERMLRNQIINLQKY